MSYKNPRTPYENICWQSYDIKSIVKKNQSALIEHVKNLAKKGVAEKDVNEFITAYVERCKKELEHSILAHKNGNVQKIEKYKGRLEADEKELQIQLELVNKELNEAEIEFNSIKLMYETQNPIYITPNGGPAKTDEEDSQEENDE